MTKKKAPAKKKPAAKRKASPKTKASAKKKTTAAKRKAAAKPKAAAKKKLPAKTKDSNKIPKKLKEYQTVAVSVDGNKFVREKSARLHAPILKFMRKNTEYTTERIIVGIGMPNVPVSYRRIRRALRALPTVKQGNNEGMRTHVWKKVK